MSKKHGKFEHGDGPTRGMEGRSKMHLNLHPVVDTKHKENVVRRLAELFQESFDLDLIQSVAQTCQWDCKFRLLSYILRLLLSVENPRCFRNLVVSRPLEH